MARTRKNSADVAGTQTIRWRICVYIRLSKEDTRAAGRQEKSTEQLKSESIINQKSILTSWITDYFEPGTWEITGFYEDDGLTGTDDSREDFMNMLTALEKGAANCVVVKALSRAFRNYADQGYYLEEYFIARNIRFISTMDSFVDTYENPDAIYNLDVPMYGVMNDRYAGATSRAVRRTFDDKREKGKFIGAFPPWGFLKDPEDKNHLILDPETAPIKIQVKDWLLHEGMSLAGAARRLNSMGIPNPARDKQLKGWKYYNPNAGNNDGMWTGSTLRRELLSPMNCGHMVQGRQKVISYKVHDRVSVPEADWYCVENTHEAVFSRADYEALCNLLVRDTRTANKADKVHLFSGYIKCAGCRKAMQRSHSKGYVYYKCRTRAEKSKQACTIHSIREDKLEAAVLAAIRMQIGLMESMAVSSAGADAKAADSNAVKRQRKMLADKKRELKDALSVADSLYADWKLGEIDAVQYRRMRAAYKEKINNLENIIDNIQTELQQTELHTADRNQASEQFLQDKNIRGLNRLVLLSMVDNIYVHENKEITIRFRFKDELLRVAQLQERSDGNMVSE